MSSVTKRAPAAIAVALALPSIMIVDDDRKFLDGARDYFSSCGFSVDTALTPEEGKRILEEKGKDYYQLIVTDYDFGEKSDTKGDEFVRENRHLFGKTKIAIISGAAVLTEQIRRQLKEAEDLFLEKNPNLKTTLKDLTHDEHARRANELERAVKREMAPRIEKMTGVAVDVKVVTEPSLLLRRPISDMAVERLKQTLVRWLKSRGEPDEPVLAYGDDVYTANQMIEHVEGETEVGLAHLQMLLRQFEYSLEVEGDDSQH